MEDTPPPIWINLISDSEEDEYAVAGADNSFEEAPAANVESAIIPFVGVPFVGSAEGDEDEESSVDEDVEMIDEASETPPVPLQDELQVPVVEREPYLMDHSLISPPFTVSVPVPEPFEAAGLRDSAHFNQWLRSLTDEQTPAPPHAEHLSEMQAAVFMALSVNLQREAANLPLLRSLVAAAESEILELERVEYLVTRVACSPIMRVAAAAQGADLQLPQWLRNRAAAPPPNLHFGIGGYTPTGAPHGPGESLMADAIATPPASGASVQGSPAAAVARFPRGADAPAVPRTTHRPPSVGTSRTTGLNASPSRSSRVFVNASGDSVNSGAAGGRHSGVLEESFYTGGGGRKGRTGRPGTGTARVTHAGGSAASNAVASGSGTQIRQGAGRRGTGGLGGVTNDTASGDIRLRRHSDSVGRFPPRGSKKRR